MIFVGGQIALGEELAEFVVEGFGAVVFALVLDVGGDGVEIGLGVISPRIFGERTGC